MSVSKNQYDKMAKAASPDSPVVMNCIKAFFFGGAICCFGEFLFYIYSSLLNQNTDRVRILVPVTIIVITSIITAFGVFDNIARHAGAGTVVPITGFANAVVSPALEFKAEGFVLGTAAKMFTIAGPVIVYGTAASVIYGVIYWITTLF